MMRRFPRKAGGKRGSSGPPAYFIPPDLYSAFDPPKEGIPAWRTRTSGRTNFKTKLGGLASFMQDKFERSEDVVIPAPLPKEENPTQRTLKFRWELKEFRKDKARAEYALKAQQRLAAWDPHAPDAKKTEDGYLTLFVGRLDPKVTEDQLKDFMAKQTGSADVSHVRIVKDLKNPKRCYAFVQFSNDKSLQKAFHAADGVSLSGKPIIVDVERGRTVRAWVPQRFGGGLGGPVRKRGFVLKQGRGAPEPPLAQASRKRRADMPPQGARGPIPRRY